jgi:hypothetical protein
MTTLAGQMSNAAQPNAQWVAANGQPLYVLDPKQPLRTHAGISEGNRQDFIRQVGWQGRRRGLGPLGWIVLMPLDKTAAYKVSTADDSSETTLTPPVPTVGKPPAGIT